MFSVPYKKRNNKSHDNKLSPGRIFFLFFFLVFIMSMFLNLDEHRPFDLEVIAHSK